MRHLLSCAAAFVLALSAASAYGQTFTDMVIFGDSLSDTGNIYTASENTSIAALIQLADPTQQVPYPQAPYFNRRFSNGPIWVDFLATHLALPTPQGDLQNVGPLIGDLVTGSGGSNFAVGGAETSNTTGDLASFDDVTEQVARYTSNNTPASDELFVMLAGGNNINGGETDHNVIVSDLTGSITDLYNDGARHILVSNLPLVGETPGNGGDAGKNNVSLAFNAAYWAALDALEVTLADMTIYRMDFYGLMQSVVANPAAFGFTNTTDAAYDEDTEIIDPNFDDFVYWDGIHPTTEFHELMGDAAFAVIPEPGTLCVLFAGAGLLVSRRRR